MQRLKRQDIPNGGNLLGGTADSTRTDIKPKTTVFVTPSAPPVNYEKTTTQTIIVTRTSSPQDRHSPSGSLVAAIVVPFILAILICVGVFFYLRWKRTRPATYHAESYPNHRDSPTPPSSPTKLKAFMLEKMAQGHHLAPSSNVKKKPSIQYHPDLDTPTYLVSTKPAKQNRDVGEKKKEEWHPQQQEREETLQLTHSKGSSRPKLNISQPTQVLPLPRYPSSVQPAPPKKRRTPPPINTQISPADLYVAQKKEKGSRKIQKFEQRAEKVQSVQSTGSTLVLPVIKPVKSIKRKPAPKELDLAKKSKTRAAAAPPPPSAVSTSFSKGSKMAKHTTVQTESSFYCRGNPSVAASPPPVPTQHADSILDNVLEEEDEDLTRSILEDMVQDLQDQTPTPDAEEPVHVRSSIFDAPTEVSRQSVVSGVSWFSRPGAPAPPPSVAGSD